VATSASRSRANSSIVASSRATTVAAWVTAGSPQVGQAAGAGAAGVPQTGQGGAQVGELMAGMVTGAGRRWK
jgi:hypothetical protein